MIHTPIFCFDGADCTVYRSVTEAEGDIEPPEAADPRIVLFGADGARLRLDLGPNTTLPERPRWWRPAWKGPAEVLVRESAEPAAPADLAARLRDYLAFLGTPRDELAGLGLGELVERAAAASS